VWPTVPSEDHVSGDAWLNTENILVVVQTTISMLLCKCLEIPVAGKLDSARMGLAQVHVSEL
jgi:hypothetical protein